MKTKLLFSVFLFFAIIPYVKSQWTYTNLSAPRDRMGAAVLGSKAYFAGGADKDTLAVSSIQVYDVKREAWDTDIPLNLSVARMHPACVAAGSKVFFAGGIDMKTAALFSEVDIWDTLTKQWTVKNLSVPRVFLSAVSNGEKVLFAGGVDLAGPGPSFDVVDIYDVATGLWSVAKLSIPRTGMGAAVAGNRAFFAGGIMAETLKVTKRIDIYDFSTGTWSIDSLSEARGMLAGVALGNKVLFAGGTNADNEPSGRVDIFDVSNGTWSTAELSEPRALFPDPAAAAINSNQAVFSCGGHFDLYKQSWSTFSDRIDIYNSSTNTWSSGKLTQSLCLYAVAGLQNHFIVAGGASPSYALVDKVEIYSPTLIHVPADYPKIQLAIDAASDGDTVLVAENTYFENINFKGKAIVVGSEFILDSATSHITNTIINGSQPLNPDIGSVVTFESGEDTTSVLCGFTITGGTGSIEIIDSTDWRIGGGINIVASGAKLLSNYIEGNTVSNTGGVMGGGILAGGEVTDIPWVVVRNNMVRNNKGLSSEDAVNGGGALICYNLIMADNEISYNEANGSWQAFGGGAFIYGAFGPIHVTVRNNLITENNAESVSNISVETNGGGLAIIKCSGIVSDNIISHNTIESSPGKTGFGAGVLVMEVIANDFVFENSLIDSNTYEGETCVGGGMILYNTGGKYQNNVIVDNKAKRGGGITIANNPGEPPVLINNTITWNTATTFGAGLYIADAKAVVINTILWGNAAPTDSSIHQLESTLDVRYSDVQGNNVWLGEGNMNVDPEFETDGYHLKLGSPLLNKGKSSLEIDGVTYNCPLFDFNREKRPFANTEPEIGADELQTDVSIGEPILANGLSISLYPNPANRMVTISVKDKTAIDEVEIYNQTGQKVLLVKPVKNTLDISSLQPGIYYCRLKTDNQVITKKIIKY
jgi:hypothetical protein